MTLQENMKKYLLILPLLFLGIFLMPHFSFADTLNFSTSTPGVATLSYTQSGAGTITSWTINPATCYVNCTNANTTPGTGELEIAGIVVSSSTMPALGNAMIGTSTASGTWNIADGQSVSLVISWPYELDGMSGSVTGSNLVEASATPLSNLHFVFPVQGTSTGLFSPWILSASSTNPGDTYVTRVAWTACPIGAGASSTACTPMLYNDAQQTGAQIQANGISIPRVDWSFDFQNNVEVFAYSQIQDINSGILLQGDSINFTLLSIPNSSPSSTLATGGIYTYYISTGNGTYAMATTTSGYAATNALGTSTASAYCPPPGDPSGYIGYGICQAAIFIFHPTQSVQNYMQSGATNLEGAMPFSLAFGFLNAVQSSTSVAPTENDIAYTISAGSAGNVALSLVTSSTLSTSFGTANKNLIFQWEDYLIWLMVLFAIFMEVYAFIHVMAGHRHTVNVKQKIKK